MSASRKAIFTTIRASLKRSAPLQGSVAGGLEARLQNGPGHPRPALDGTPEEHFARRWRAAGGSCSRLGDSKGVPVAVARYLRRHDLGSRLVRGGGSILDQLHWPPRLTVRDGVPRDEDAVAVTEAWAAVAETGSVVLCSSSFMPATLSFLPACNLVVVSAARILRYQEDVWAKLRCEGKDMPRGVHLITGPSRTADVEQTLQIGAHGPGRVHVFIVP